MESPVTKRSIALASHKTSISLEEEFWQALHEIAGDRGTTVNILIREIDRDRKQSNLSSAVRLYVLAYFMAMQPESTLRNAG